MLLLNRYDTIFGLRADAEFSTPNAYATRHIVVGFSPRMRTISLFIEGAFNPVDGPHLAIVGVSAELKIDVLSLGCLQMVGLMVEQNGVWRAIDGLHNVV